MPGGKILVRSLGPAIGTSRDISNLLPHPWLESAEERRQQTMARQNHHPSAVHEEAAFGSRSELSRRQQTVWRAATRSYSLEQPPRKHVLDRRVLNRRWGPNAASRAWQTYLEAWISLWYLHASCSPETVPARKPATSSTSPSSTKGTRETRRNRGQLGSAGRMVQLHSDQAGYR